MIEDLVLTKVNEVYKALKIKKGTPPELIPEVQSDQVKAIVVVFSALIEKQTTLSLDDLHDSISWMDAKNMVGK